MSYLDEDERFITYRKDSESAIVESESTIVQEETEEECQPFLVDFRKLDVNHLEHLRQVGLLPPYEVPLEEEDEKEKEEDEGWESKAHRVLGLDETNDSQDSESPRIILLDETTTTPLSKTKTKAFPKSSLDIRLLRGKHASYLKHPHYSNLPSSYVSLDASRPWIIYWTLHSCDLLHDLPPEYVLVRVVETLDSCWMDFEVELSREEVNTMILLKKNQTNGGDDDTTTTEHLGKEKMKMPAGGYGGGPGQLAHCAPTYAAVLTLCIIASHSPSSASSQMALSLLHKVRLPLYAWFLSLRYHVPPYIASSFLNNTSNTQMTGYRMHHDGEVDVRATYTILTITSLLNITTKDLTNGAAMYVSSCQTYEGGFGGEFMNEAHGGYTYCALGALVLLLQQPWVTKDEKEHMEQLVEWKKLRGWLVRRQMSYEGGFNGRCNKLVDGCYSFWQGASLAILDVLEYTTTADSTQKKKKEQVDVCGDYGFSSGIYIPSSPDSSSLGKKFNNEPQTKKLWKSCI